MNENIVVEAALPVCPIWANIGVRPYRRSIYEGDRYAQSIYSGGNGRG